MSARSRAFPWWGERKAPIPPPPAAPLELPTIEPSAIDVYFTQTISWYREAWKAQGRDLLGFPVFYVERESWPADVAEKDCVLREAGFITVDE